MNYLHGSRTYERAGAVFTLRPPLLALLALLGSVAALGVTGCDNDCDFFERCNGDVREVCGDGPDQVVHRRVRSEPCEAPNTVCVERDEDHAACVLPDVVTCDHAVFVPRCEGDLRVGCTSPLSLEEDEPAGYEVGSDCQAAGRVCLATDAGATCEPP
jgi:hypothetical protein